MACLLDPPKPPFRRQFRRIFRYGAGPASEGPRADSAASIDRAPTESLWTWIVASITLKRRAAVLVAVHACCHRDWSFLGDHVALSNRAVARLATDLRFLHMNLVREVDEIRYSVYLHPRHRLLFLPVFGELLDERAVC